MPAYVNQAACDGYQGRGEPECQRICPADIIQLTPSGDKAEVIEPDGCWECFACVKACPRGAMTVRGAADVVPLGGRLIPRRADASIAWTVVFRNGSSRQFEFPVRTTAWGSIEPCAGMAPARGADLKSGALCGECQEGSPQAAASGVAAACR